METIFTGPLLVSGNMDEILNAAGQGQSGSVLVPDPNPARGPAILFQGDGLPDIRFWFQKDKLATGSGLVPSHLSLPFIASADVIPATVQTNNIAAAQTVVQGAAMALAVASTGIVLNVPIIPFTGFGGLNGAAPIIAPMALDFGFAFGTTVAGNLTITVADSTQFPLGMPLVIGGVGNAAGTTCLLTTVTGAPTAITITVNDAPQAAAAAAPIGTGNVWGPGQFGFPTPTAALPYLAGGPGLFFDPQQGLSRGVQVVGTAGGNAGGNFLVTGYDCYGMLMTELVTVAAGASAGFSKKAFKYIVSVVPQFADGANTYTVGTSDVFGFSVRSDRWEFTNVCWNGAFMTASQGWLAGDTTNPATNIRGDVRGTVQVSGNGATAGGGIGATATNGTIVALAMSGRRLVMFQSIPVFNVLRGIVVNTISMYGVTQQ